MGKAYLVLENGSVYQGRAFGAEKSAVGEVVFTTGMTGYLETLTDKSYFGQIVVQTFPLIGNYGVIRKDFEGDRLIPKAYIVREYCETPSNFRSEGKIDDLLKEFDIPGLCGIDTRALTKELRERGVMNGKIVYTEEDVKKALEDKDGEIKNYAVREAVKNVTVSEPKTVPAAGEKKLTVALLDLGYKNNIVNCLAERGCDVVIYPGDTKPEVIKAANPDGIMLSNGPGDPAENVEIIKNIAEMCTFGIPVFGICLGHQLLALAHGFETKKLKFGHRGANQPVQDLLTKRVFISTQNHGYAVVSESIDTEKATEWFNNVNDKSCEGIIYKEGDVRSVQFHPEASAGPQDTAWLFDEFVSRMEARK